MRYFSSFVAVALLVTVVNTQSPASVLAPTGTLRAVFLGSNPVHGRVVDHAGDRAGRTTGCVQSQPGGAGLQHSTDAIGTALVEHRVALTPRRRRWRQSRHGSHFLDDDLDQTLEIDVLHQPRGRISRSRILASRRM